MSFPWMSKKTPWVNLQKGQLWDYCFFWITWEWEVSAKKESMMMGWLERDVRAGRLFQAGSQGLRPIWCSLSWFSWVPRSVPGLCFGIGRAFQKKEKYIIWFISFSYVYKGIIKVFYQFKGYLKVNEN